MKLFRSAIWSLLTGFLAFGNAEAGTLRTEVRSFPDLGGSGSSLAIKADDRGVTLTPAGNSYSLSVTDQSTYLASLVVNVQQAPTGYQTFEYRVDMPFFWDGQNNKLFGALSKETPDNETAQRFASILSHTSLTDIGDVLLLHQRAERIYRFRMPIISQGATPLPSDVSVAYVLLLTGRELSDHLFVAVDDTTESAKRWLLQVVATRPPYYDPKSVPSTDVHVLANQLDMHDATVYHKIAEKIETGINSPIPSIGAAACSKAHAFHTFLRELGDGEYQSILNGGNATHIKITTDDATCLARALTAAKKAGKNFSDDDKQSAADIYADFDRLIPIAKNAEKANAIVARRVLITYIPDRASP